MTDNYPRKQDEKKVFEYSEELVKGGLEAVKNDEKRHGIRSLYSLRIMTR